MFSIKMTAFCFVFTIEYLNGMDHNAAEQLRKYQELKEEREARKQSGQGLQPKQDNFGHSLSGKLVYTEYQKRVSELEKRLAEFEKKREARKNGNQFISQS